MSQVDHNPARSIRNLPEKQLLDGYRLVGKIETTRMKLRVGQHHHCRFGPVPVVKFLEEQHYR